MDDALAADPDDFAEALYQVKECSISFYVRDMIHLVPSS